MCWSILSNIVVNTLCCNFGQKLLKKLRHHRGAPWLYIISTSIPCTGEEQGTIQSDKKRQKDKKTKRQKQKDKKVAVMTDWQLSQIPMISLLASYEHAKYPPAKKHLVFCLKIQKMRSRGIWIVHNLGASLCSGRWQENCKSERLQNFIKIPPKQIGPWCHPARLLPWISINSQ